MSVFRSAGALAICAFAVAACASRGGEPGASSADAEGESEDTSSAISHDGVAEESPPNLVDDTDTTSGSRTKGPLDFVEVRGPLASLDEYRKERASEWDSSCGAPPKRAKRPALRAGARKKIRAVELLRVPSRVACTPVEYCALAFRTDDGWYVRDGESPCDGENGKSRRVQTKDERLVWVDLPDVHVLEYRYSVVATAKSERTEQEGTTPLQGPTTHESENTEETKWLVLCGAGESARPKCTSPLLTSCPAADGSIHTVSWKYQDRTLLLESASDPSSACESIVLGSYALEIP